MSDTTDTNHDHEFELEFVPEEAPKDEASATVTQPPSDELEFEIPKELVTPNSERYVPLIPFSSFDQVEKAFQTRLQKLGTDTFLAQARVPGSYERLLTYLYTNPSEEAFRAHGSIKAALEEDAEHFGTLGMGSDKRPLGMSSMRSPASVAENKLVTGDQALMALYSHRDGGIGRFLAYNTGVFFDVRQPSNRNLNDLISKCRFETMEYGRLFGFQFYAFADFYVRQQVFEFFIEHIMSSNLNNWRKTGVIAQSMRLPDFDALLVSMIAGMYPEGYPNYQSLCTRPVDQDHPENECTHVETLTIAPKELLRTNFGHLTEKAVTYLSRRSATPPMKFEDLKDYQAELGFDDQVIDWGRFRFIMRVPTMADYFQAGEKLLVELLNEIAADNTAEIYKAVSFQYARMFLPYIKRVILMRPDGGEGNYIEGRDEIAAALIELSTEDTKNEATKLFEDYANKTKLSSVCVKAYACPACGHVPETETGFLTIDAIAAFFTIGGHKLEQI